MSAPSAAEIIALLGLERHPEGGWYAQTFADAAGPDGRAHSTAIYFLLEGGDRSHWHRVDAAEVWHWYAGAPLVLEIADSSGSWALALGGDLLGGERPQAVVPRGAWQAARSTGEWTLVGCTVAPGFRFSGFELAAPDWTPER
ncbi:MAG: cupin [Devosia sp.]|jgi:predicted cupin superfamily sugar epimerase|nr:cupin [Devosia sp.]